jgi:hypothetical protein
MLELEELKDGDKEHDDGPIKIGSKGVLTKKQQLELDNKKA